MLKFNDSYFINFFLLFGYIYNITKDYWISLSIGFINLFVCTFLNYMLEDTQAQAIKTIFFTMIILYSSNLIKLISQYTKQIVFVSITYILFSMCEWIIHKYIMHCNKQSMFYYLLNLIDQNGVIEETCDHHIEHHKEVRPNMTLSKVTHKTSLFMGWHVCVYIFLFIFISMLIAMFISRIKIQYTSLVIASIGFTVVWSYLWNKVHPLMHQYNGKYTIKEGPYEPNLNFNLVNKLFYRNHQYHHLQKGVKKGNYNVIIFGADEWFGTNVKKINNKEYCSNPNVANEEICKN
jgi:hypothetical protein